MNKFSIEWGIYMMRKKILKVLGYVILIMLFIQTIQLDSVAKEATVSVDGVYYELDSDSDYDISAKDVNGQPTPSPHVQGDFVVSGDYSEETKDGIEVPVLKVKKGTLELAYSARSIQKEFVKEDENTDKKAWHMVEDKSDTVDGVELESDIKMGALILQSSLDGKKWQEEVVLTDIFNSDKYPSLDGILYETKSVQQQNGCYYRLIIAYTIGRKTGEKKIGPVTLDETEQKKIAEVYRFYAIDEEIEETTRPEDTPRKELGKKVNTGKDTGYANNDVVDIEDPHYGWDLGTFYVNGYTREVIDEQNTSIFLKNVGDRVTLWFRLEEVLDQLNGEADLSIAEDVNGYDKEFEVKQTNFGRGALIISYTDYEGVVHEPVIYTNYLEANARTGADTRVQLFEEGDYKVTLDYEIIKNPRKLGAISVLPSYTNYKISFEFAIRNGNNMVYPFDAVTGAELSDQAITDNGFRLDMAKSRYLTIDVKKSSIRTMEDGSLVEDIRFNRPAKDGEGYTDEGIYTFTVKNLYTEGEPTTKTIYVGSNKYIHAISRSGYTVAELNEKIAAGAQIGDDGKIIEAVESSEVEDVIDEAQVQTVENEDSNVIKNEATDGDQEGIAVVPIVIGCSIIVCVILVVVLRKQRDI